MGPNPPSEPNPANPQSHLQAPMGAHPPEAPRINAEHKQAFQDTEPPGFKDHAESSVDAADFDVDDTIGGE